MIDVGIEVWHEIGRSLVIRGTAAVTVGQPKTRLIIPKPAPERVPESRPLHGSLTLSRREGIDNTNRVPRAV
jgi:hypothetical protein